MCSTSRGAATIGPFIPSPLYPANKIMHVYDALPNPHYKQNEKDYGTNTLPLRTHIRRSCFHTWLWVALFTAVIAKNFYSPKVLVASASRLLNLEAVYYTHKSPEVIVKPSPQKSPSLYLSSCEMPSVFWMSIFFVFAGPYHDNAFSSDVRARRASPHGPFRAADPAQGRAQSALRFSHA